MEENLAAIRDSEARLERLEQQIANIVPDWTLAPVVEAIQAMRGISHIAAVTWFLRLGTSNDSVIHANSSAMWGCRPPNIPREKRPSEGQSPRPVQNEDDACYRRSLDLPNARPRR